MPVESNGLLLCSSFSQENAAKNYYPLRADLIETALSIVTAEKMLQTLPPVLYAERVRLSRIKK